MSDQIDLHLLALASIAHRCTRETEAFFQRQAHDPTFCYELFRRAIVDRCQPAWDVIYAQYRPLVAGWVERHRAFAVSGEEVQFFANEEFVLAESHAYLEYVVEQGTWDKALGHSGSFVERFVCDASKIMLIEPTLLHASD